MNKLKVHVTKTDLKKGVRNSCVTCPVALAVARISGCSVLVTREVLWIGREKYQLPEIVKNFIARFDAGKAVEPIKFSI